MVLLKGENSPQHQHISVSPLDLRITACCGKTCGDLVLKTVEVIGSSKPASLVLRKRKASQAFIGINQTLITRQSVSSNCSREEGEEEEEDTSFCDSETDNAETCSSGEEDEEDITFVGGPSGSATPRPRLKSYMCTFEGCTKAYTKPSRLAEHQRSHTGERPYTCSKCSKSYLRESHLQAHSRSHLPDSERPLSCSEKGCSKRFWTGQHLNAHVAKVHHGEKPFSCAEPGCEECFAKHNQLRRHIAEAHRGPGTKPYLCPTDGCTKSFATNQKLQKHSKVHEEHRYACTDPKCASSSSSSAISVAVYFSTWTALQAHLRERHPPTCPFPECNGRVFASQKGLKGHLKVHGDRQLEDSMTEFDPDGDRPAKRRRGGEVGRDWVCQTEGCIKAFKSKKALTTHNNITHLGRRDFVCPIAECGRTFGYKHLLQRHTAKAHVESTAGSNGAEDGSPSESEESPSTIGWLTGKDYATSSSHRNTHRPLLPCPWPDGFESDVNIGQCSYMFHRAYDLRRHLKVNHVLELTKNEVDAWAKAWRDRRPL